LAIAVKTAIAKRQTLNWQHNEWPRVLGDGYFAVKAVVLHCKTNGVIRIINIDSLSSDGWTGQG
jgi:hypothetical protein